MFAPGRQGMRRRISARIFAELFGIDSAGLPDWGLLAVLQAKAKLSMNSTPENKMEKT